MNDNAVVAGWLILVFLIIDRILSITLAVQAFKICGIN